ncbi:biotin transport system substrate-specific component [Dehalogenimonas formicexedens]|uniref:Biotin transporter n=1 Tax=Dehalogenimonas formicexedens TaxID=1839801 RepID=A0A1P8F7V8_9CHLR|nr:biotin transporter BioY [Dehalogenimonas formicexedens]APV44566.1 biotin transport system substrate-specific component [Dehalogenimonas formicexedens]
MELTARFDRVKTDVFRRRAALSVPAKIILALSFAALTGLLAQVKIYLPFTPVPVTLQTFAVLLAGVALGRWWGGISMAAYGGLGILGVPWLANGASGFGATFGYLVGFVLAAMFVGYMAETFVRSRGFTPMFGIMAAAGLLLVYVPGAIWLAIWLGMAGKMVTLASVISMGVVPFIAGDIIKTMGAAAISKIITPRSDYRGT